MTDVNVKYNDIYDVKFLKGLSDAIRSLKGVAGLSKGPSNGIKITRFANRGTDGGYEFDVYVIALYGARIPQVAWELQNVIKSYVTKHSDFEVLKVNVYVQGVSFEKRVIDES